MTSQNTEPKKQKQIYDNCEIYGPNDKLIGLCSKNRLKWYISKGIAEEIEGNGNAIKLKFEPKYRNNELNTSIRIKRENKCYVCDATKELLRFHVVPTEYKRSFPDEWKSHNSVDVLPLCQECSEYANSYAQDLKNQLNEEYNIYRDDFIDHDRVELKILSKKIMNNRKYGLYDQILMSKLNTLVGHTVTEQELKEYSECDTSLTYKETKSPPEYIVKQIIQQGKIKEFIKRWKDHFIDTMSPSDLPKDFYCDR